MFFTFHQIGSLESSNGRPRGEPFRDRAPRSGLAVTGGYRLLRQWCCIRYGNPPISDSHDAYICIFRVIFRLFFNTEEPKQATKCEK